MDIGRVWGKRKRKENVKLEVRGINMTKRYFIGGFTWENESQKERFLTEGIWENGYDDKFKDVYDRIRIGDYIGLKSTYVKQRKSWLRIHSIGEVKSVSKDSMLLCVNWFNIEQKDITGITWYADTLCEITNKNHIYNIFGMNDLKEQVSTFSTILVSNRNLILTGAPGTGKTYLAKQIAKAMGCTDNEIGFVQFHPSYDYTDFVEGLRPIQDEDGNVGFERKDGVFKAFCKKAIESRIIDGTDNFEEGWKRLVDYLNENQYIEIPLLTGARNICVELNEYGTGLAERLYADGKSVGDGEWVRGHSKFFTKEQLYNIYQGNNGTPSGGHDNYRRAIVKYMIDNKWLKEYKPGHEKSESSRYVFIIDEINRGEISKIFGELFFSIDPGYRGKDGKVRTQYANMQVVANIFDQELNITNSNDYGHFFVPENVYIIGTMNDIDRSVESMDFAFRRRFAFKEITAEESKQMLDSENAWGKDENGNSRKPNQADIDTIKNKMNAINNVIWHKEKEEKKDEDKSIEGLSSAYHIGASYFLKLVNYKNADGSYDYDQLWDNHLEGLLREYMRGMQDVETKIDKLKKAYGYPSNSNND